MRSRPQNVDNDVALAIQAVVLLGRFQNGDILAAQDLGHHELHP
jgi:hypothetical protein